MVVEKSFHQSNPETGSAVEKRIKSLLELGLLEAKTIPVFEASTQTAADFLEVPICILGFIDESCHWFKSAVGLSRLGLMNQLATTRSLSSDESFCTHVVENYQVLAISDARNEPAFAKSVLVQRYGIRAYLGVPLMDFSGNCLGTIAVMDLQPRTFTLRDIKFLELLGSWSMSEFERNRLLKTTNSSTAYSAPASPLTNSSPSETNGTPLVSSGACVDFVKITTSPISNDSLFAIQVKVELLAQLTQELRTPLTSVVGMANVVGREIYGPLTSKQKEYIEIIQDSGRYLLSMANEISELGVQDESTRTLNLTSVDIEMLCQQVSNTLSNAAQRREQQIRLSLKPGRSRIWVLDRDKVRQLLYHLVFSVIQTATTGSVIHIHISHKGDGLNLTVSVSHPWLGAGLTQIDSCFYQLLGSDGSNYPEAKGLNEHLHPSAMGSQLDSEWSELPMSGRAAQPLLSLSADISAESELVLTQLNSQDVSVEGNRLYRSCETLRLLLSYHLAKLHCGQISVQGTAELGYRYVVSLPQLQVVKESL